MIKDWILIRARSGKEIANIIANYSFSLSEFQPRLNILYLIHDILCHWYFLFLFNLIIFLFVLFFLIFVFSVSKRIDKVALDKVSEAFEPYLKNVYSLFFGETSNRLGKILEVS